MLTVSHGCLEKNYGVAPQIMYEFSYSNCHYFVLIVIFYYAKEVLIKQYSMQLVRMSE